MPEVRVLQTPRFERQKRRLKRNQILCLDEAIRQIIQNPRIGQEKRGALKGVWVHKFRIHTQEYLLAYEWDPKTRTLVALGVHENFYRDLEQSR